METLDALELALPAAVDLDDTARTITGLIVPFNVDANRTSMGKPVRFATNCLLLPADLSRVKLLLDHDHGKPVGYALTIDQDEAGARATFRVSSGAAGDAALADAREKLRDGLSVGVDIRTGYMSADGTAYIVEQAVINEVSLCSIPAFADARVTKITATHTTTPPEEENPTMTETTTPPAATPPAVTETTPPSATFTQAPAFNTSHTKAPLTLEAAYDAIAAAIQTSTSASQIQAALSDIIPAADAGKGLLPDQLIGEVWKARAVETPYVDFAFSKKPLNGINLVGYAWATRATVAAYTGNKTAIPSGTVSTVPVTATAKRLAGGWDVDRVFLDLGDGSMIREIIEQAIDDYKDKCNAAARTALLAAATPLTSTGMTVDEVLVALGSAATAIGAKLDYLAIAPDLWSAFASLTRDQVPWWLNTTEGIGIGQNSGNIGRINLWVDPDLSSGQWVAGDKRAATWWSKEPPVRVQAVDLAKGGVDAGVFGYYAEKVNEPLAVWTGDTNGA